MNNISFDISLNDTLPINDIPNSDELNFNVDNNIRTLFRNRILNLLNLTMSDDYNSSNINNFINSSLYQPKKDIKIISAKGKNVIIY